MMRLFFFLVALVGLLSCGTTKVSNEKPPKNTDLTLELICYRNAMPFSGSESYVIINITPTEKMVNEKIKITSIEAVGENGTWKTTTFDQNDYGGFEHMGYQNTARKFDDSIGSPYDFKVEIQFSSGKTKSYEVKKVPLQVVH